MVLGADILTQLYYPCRSSAIFHCFAMRCNTAYKFIHTYDHLRLYLQSKMWKLPEIISTLSHPFFVSLTDKLLSMAENTYSKYSLSFFKQLPIELSKKSNHFKFLIALPKFRRFLYRVLLRPQML